MATVLVVGILLIAAYKLGKASGVAEALDERELEPTGAGRCSRSSSVYDREADEGWPDGLYLLLLRRTEDAR